MHPGGRLASVLAPVSPPTSDPRLRPRRLRAERLELVDHPVQGRLVGERAGEQRVPSTAGGGERRERLHDRRADRPAHADLVALRLAIAGRSRLV